MDTRTSLITSMFLLVSGFSALVAKTQLFYGDRPYHDSERSGWLDYEYHTGIEFRSAKCLRGRL
jgi:hypothetical protein